MAVKPEVLDKETQVVKLRREGMTWDEIAIVAGYASKAGAYTAYKRASTRVVEEDIKELRQLGQERLDTALKAIWPDVLAGDIPAINTLIRLEERRAKLYGLDMPTKIQAEVVTYDYGSVSANLAEIVAQLANTSTQSGLGELESTPEPTTD